MKSDDLVSLDILRSDEELRAAARAASPRLAADRETEGRDATRSVVVRTDHRGRVSDVSISNWWRDKLTPAGLREAILSAYRDAVAEAAAAIDPARPGDRTLPTALSLDDDAEGDDDRTWFEQLRRRLDRTEGRLDHSGRLLTETHPVERVVSGSAGLVHLVLSGSTVTRAEIDARVALHESPNRLAADTLAAFQAIG